MSRSRGMGVMNTSLRTCSSNRAAPRLLGACAASRPCLAGAAAGARCVGGPPCCVAQVRLQRAPRSQYARDQWEAGQHAEARRQREACQG